VDKRAGLKKCWKEGDSGMTFQGAILWLSAFVGSKPDPFLPEEKAKAHLKEGVFTDSW